VYGLGRHNIVTRRLRSLIVDVDHYIRTTAITAAAAAAVLLVFDITRLMQIMFVFHAVFIAS